VYEASFVLPLVMLAIVLALAAPHGSIRMRHGVAALALGIGPLALLSMLLVAGYYGPPMMEAAKARGILPLQPWSVPVFGYGGERAQMLGLARQCRLPEPAQASHLLIDDMSYFAFMQSRLPQHHLAILVPRMAGSISDPLAYLRARAQSRGIYCCLSQFDSPSAQAPLPQQP
jgi:hypothetical protein